MRTLSLYWLVPLTGLYFFFPMPVIQGTCGVMGAFLVLSWLAALSARSAVVLVKVSPTLRSFPGQGSVVKLRLKNRWPWPTGPLVFQDFVGNLELLEGEARREVSLRGWQVWEWEYTVTSRTRGAWPLGPLSLEGQDPAGLFPWKISLGESRQVIVYPRTPALEGLPLRGLQTGDLRRGNWVDPARLAGLRYPRDGEDLRYLDAPASAAQGKLVVREFQVTLDAPAVVILNLYSEHYPLRNRYLYTERALESAASVAMEFWRHGESLGLVTNGLLPEDIPPGILPQRGGEHFTRLLETLAWLKPAEEELWQDPLQLLGVMKSPLHGIYIGPPPPQAMDEVLGYLADRGFFITLLLAGTSAVAPVTRPRMRTGILGDYGEIRLAVL